MKMNEPTVEIMNKLISVTLTSKNSELYVHIF